MTKRTRYSLNLGGSSVTQSSFAIFCQIIAEYTKRNMSYATDRLVGVDGVLNVIRRTGNMLTLYGLPEKLLDDA
jgi:hypothetical protein